MRSLLSCVSWSPCGSDGLFPGTESGLPLTCDMHITHHVNLIEELAGLRQCLSVVHYTSE